MGTAIAVILCFFAIYGMLQLLAKGLFSVRSRRGNPPAKTHRVIILQNCQDSIEGMVRSLAWEDVREELVVIDLNSTDDTGEILRFLAAEYDFLHLMTPEEYKEYIEKLLHKSGDTNEKLYGHHSI